MKLKLKNIKYSATFSQGSPCFSATIYVDDVKTGEVENSGRGAAYRISPYSLQEQLDAYAATLPHEDISEMYNDGKVHLSLRIGEDLISDLLFDWIEATELKRQCKTKTIYRLPGHEYKKGECLAFKNKFNPSVKEAMFKKFGPDVFILNEN